VADHDYAFVLMLSGHARDTEMLIDLLKTVLQQAGYSGDTLERLVRQVTSVRAAVPAPQRCDVRFETRGGELQIVVSQAGRDWRTTCPVLTH
jgi:hypothetical protein